MIARRLFKNFVQQGRSEVRDAKNNERHVRGRARVVSAQCLRGEAYSFSPTPPELLWQLLPGGMLSF